MCIEPEGVHILVNKQYRRPRRNRDKDRHRASLAFLLKTSDDSEYKTFFFWRFAQTAKETHLPITLQFPQRKGRHNIFFLEQYSFNKLQFRKNSW